LILSWPHQSFHRWWTKGEPTGWVGLATITGVCLGTASARLFVRFSLRRALASSLTGMAVAWVIGIALTLGYLIIVRPNLSSDVSQMLRLSPWMMGTCVWFVGPFIGVAMPQADLMEERRRRRSGDVWISTLAIALPIAGAVF